MKMVIAGASNVDMIRQFGKISIHQIVSSKFPKIGELRRVQGLKKTESAIGILLSQLSRSFDNALSRDDIMELCAEITSSHLLSLTLEDIFFVCRNIKRTNQFGKLNLNKVLSALDKHLNERCMVAGELSRKLHEKANADASAQSPALLPMQQHRKNVEDMKETRINVAKALKAKRA